MKTIEAPAIYHLKAAEGWLELGNYTEAHEELKQIGLEWRFHPDVLAARWKIYAMGKHWEFAHTIAHGMAALYPDNPSGWVFRSLSLHEMKRTCEAWHSLYPASEKFPENSTVSYLMARFSCQMGRIEEATTWLRRAMKNGDAQEVKMTAMEEPDLEPIFEQVGK
jgi:predicted Zn-dependent protease